MGPVAHRPRWGVILAGGDGKRLLPLTKRLTGEERPKQFCAVYGKSTLLEQTLQRVNRIVAPGRIILVLTKNHEPFFHGQVEHVSSSHLLVQPSNKGTTPAILYSLIRIQAEDASAQVAFFPSDHYVSNSQCFSSQIRLAFALAAMRPERVILLGIEPAMPESSYGWIEPGRPLDSPRSNSLCSVSRFWEKPSLSQALELYRRHCLWNSFIMVGGIAAFIGMIRRATPGIHVLFESIQDWLHSPFEGDALSGIYARMAVSSFSTDVLASNTQALDVLRSTGFEWSDLGEPSRVLKLCEKKGIKSEEEYCLMYKAGSTA